MTRILFCLAAVFGAAMPGTAAGDVPTNDPGVYLHHFEYDPPAGTTPQTVSVGGEFNNWAESGIPMKADGQGLCHG
jgi:hypothetical protein